MRKEAQALTKLASVIAKGKNQEGMTMRELMAATGWGDDKTRKLLVEAHAQGKLTSGRRLIQSIDGTMRSIPVYKVST